MIVSLRVAAFSFLLVYASGRNQPSSSSSAQLTLTLITDSAANCSSGLTHPGVYVLVEYRLSSSPWTLLKGISLNNAGIV